MDHVEDWFSCHHLMYTKMEDGGSVQKNIYSLAELASMVTWEPAVIYLFKHNQFAAPLTLPDFIAERLPEVRHLQLGATSNLTTPCLTPFADFEQLPKGLVKLVLGNLRVASAAGLTRLTKLRTLKLLNTELEPTAGLLRLFGSERYIEFSSSNTNILPNSVPGWREALAEINEIESLLEWQDAEDEIALVVERLCEAGLGNWARF